MQKGAEGEKHGIVLLELIYSSHSGPSSKNANNYGIQTFLGVKDHYQIIVLNAKFDTYPMRKTIPAQENAGHSPYFNRE